MRRRFRLKTTKKLRRVPTKILKENVRPVGSSCRNRIEPNNVKTRIEQKLAFSNYRRRMFRVVLLLLLLVLLMLRIVHNSDVNANNYHRIVVGTK